MAFSKSQAHACFQYLKYVLQLDSLGWCGSLEEILMGPGQLVLVYSGVVLRCMVTLMFLLRTRVSGAIENCYSLIFDHGSSGFVGGTIAMQDR